MAEGNDLLACGLEDGELCAMEVRTEIGVVVVKVESQHGYTCGGRERYVVSERDGWSRGHGGV